jgi:hypothetical protein
VFIEQLVPTPKHPTVGERYDERTETAKFLIDQGWAKAATHEPPALEVHWSVSRDELTGQVGLHGKCNRDCGAFHFFGDGSLLAQDRFRFFHGCNAPEPTRVPPDVVQRYRAMREGAAASPIAAERRETLTLEDAERISVSQTKAIDGARLSAQIALERKSRRVAG